MTLQWYSFFEVNLVAIQKKKKKKKKTLARIITSCFLFDKLRPRWQSQILYCIRQKKKHWPGLSHHASYLIDLDLDGSHKYCIVKKKREKKKKNWPGLSHRASYLIDLYKYCYLMMESWPFKVMMRWKLLVSQ